MSCLHESVHRAPFARHGRLKFDAIATPITAEDPAGPARAPACCRWPVTRARRRLAAASARILREGTRTGASPTSSDSRPGRPGGAVAGLGAGRASAADSPAAESSAPWDPPGGGGRARLGRPERDRVDPAASGKSLGYLMPALTAVLEGGTTLYLTPTKALAADQLRAIRALRAARGAGRRTGRRHPVGGPELGQGARDLPADHPGHAAPRAAARARPLGQVPSRLRFVIVDECHGYRGVFGSHVAQVLRRLRRIAAYYAEGRAVRERARRGSRDGAAGRRARCSSSPRPPSPSRPGARPCSPGSRPSEIDATPRRAGRSLRALGAAAHRAARRGGRAAAADGHRRGGPAALRPGDGGPDHGGLRALPAGGRGGGHGRAAGAGGDGRRRSWPQRVAAYRAGYLPEDRRLLEERAPLRPAGRGGGHHRARARRQHQRPGRGAHRRLAGHPRLAVAAGRPGGPGRAGTRSPCSSPGTTRWTPTWCITRRRCSAARSRPPCSTPTTRTCSPRTCARRPPSCR